MSSPTTTATGLDPAVQNDNVIRRTHGPKNSKISNGEANGSVDSDNDTRKQMKKAIRSKYRHVEAVHSQSRPSCLSHDTTESPSFLGFRNLMVIVLGKYLDPFSYLKDISWLTIFPVVGNLRLIIENIQKVVPSPRNLTLTSLSVSDQTANVPNSTASLSASAAMTSANPTSTWGCSSTS